MGDNSSSLCLPVFAEHLFQPLFGDVEAVEHGNEPLEVLYDESVDLPGQGFQQFFFGGAGLRVMHNGVKIKIIPNLGEELC